MSLGELAKKYENLLSEKNRNLDRDDELKAALQAVEAELLEEMRLSGVQNFKLDSGRNLYRKTDRIIARAEGISPKDLCYELAQHADTMDLVSPHYNANTMSSKLREMIDSDHPLPGRLSEMVKLIEIERVRSTS